MATDDDAVAVTPRCPSIAACTIIARPQNAPVAITGSAARKKSPVSVLSKCSASLSRNLSTFSFLSTYHTTMTSSATRAASVAIAAPYVPAICGRPTWSNMSR